MGLTLRQNFGVIGLPLHVKYVNQTTTPDLLPQAGQAQNTEPVNPGYMENVHMMTVDCKINIDWIEDGSIDEVIQDKIVAEAVASIKTAIAAKVDGLAVDILNTRVNTMLDEIWANFMEKRVNITDKYGDPIESHESIKDMLKAKLDDFINQRVDAEGKVYPPSSKCPYNSKPRIEYMMDKLVASHTKTFIDGVQRDFDMRLKETLDKGLKSAISSSMLKQVDVGSLLKQATGGA